MPVISHRKCADRGMCCMYNSNRFTEPEVRELLANGAEKLMARAEQIAETGNAVSYRISVANRSYFAKQIKIRSWRREWHDCLLRPTCQDNFLAAGKLLAAGIRTPPPIIAAVVRGAEGRRQLLVTDWLENAVELDAFTAARARDARATLIPELADLLSQFHCAGFYSRHLRSANILVQELENRRVYSFIDLDRLTCSRFLRPPNYLSTVSRACADMYPHVLPNDRKYLLMTCFDYALKRNIFSQPSDLEGFMEAALAQIKQRNGEVS